MNNTILGLDVGHLRAQQCFKTLGFVLYISRYEKKQSLVITLSTSAILNYDLNKLRSSLHVKQTFKICMIFVIRARKPLTFWAEGE